MTVQLPALKTIDDKTTDLDTFASNYAGDLVSVFDTDPLATNIDIEAVDKEASDNAMRRSRMLRTSLGSMIKNSEDGGPVAVALIDLKMKVDQVNPTKVDFEAGWLARLMGLIPGVGTPLKRYFSRFETAEEAIDSIINALRVGQEQLKRDNVTLEEDMKSLREETYKLERRITFSRALDAQLQVDADRAEGEKKKFIEEQLIFAARQYIIDRQQKLSVCQQAILASDVAIKNNRELIKGVDRAIDVTVTALQVAVSVAVALNNQRLVLKSIQGINQTTSDIIMGTAKRMKEQGAEIQKMASSSMLDMKALSTAFEDIYSAIDSISTFRRQALPEMAQNILALDNMSKKGEAAIAQSERGKTASQDMLEKVA